MFTGARSRAMDAQLRAAIRVGAPLYNAGDVAGCATTYRATAERVLLSTDLMPQAAARLRRAHCFFSWQLASLTPTAGQRCRRQTARRATTPLLGRYAARSTTCLLLPRLRS